MVHAKTFFGKNGGNVYREPVYVPFKILAAGKCQVVGVARILGARRVC
jgi:hypothetical protein